MDLIFLIISAVPGLEARASTVYFVCSNSYYLIPVAIIINFIAVIVFIKLMDKFGLPFALERFLKKRLSKKMDKIENWFRKYGDVAIFLLIALPASGVGSYSGAFLGRIFGLKGKKFYLSILLAIAASIIPALFLGYGITMLDIKC